MTLKLHEWVFRKACTSRFGECNFSFLKNSQVQINSKLNEKNCMIFLLMNKYKHEKIYAKDVLNFTNSERSSQFCART